MNPNIQVPQKTDSQLPPLRPSVLPTIDRVTGRLFKAMLVVVACGVVGVAALALYRVLGR
ncbi:hypothetical protein [Piscinibacter terrae]|uniref:hypothetical protein n=1 Tax=Piscinibacter terrae TaxID=2496871 RepID=UPI000F5B6AB1|nr:hypothetical protein [Albitalea terrae]